MQTGTFSELGAPLDSLESELNHRGNLYNLPNYLQTIRHDATQPIAPYPKGSLHTHPTHININKLPGPPTPEKLDMFEPMHPHASVSHTGRVIQPPVEYYRTDTTNRNYSQCAYNDYAECDNDSCDEYECYNRSYRYPYNNNNKSRQTIDPSLLYMESKLKNSQMRVRAKYCMLRKEIKNIYRLISIMMQTNSNRNLTQYPVPNIHNNNNTSLWCMVVGLTVAVIFMFIFVLLCWKRLPG